MLIFFLFFASRLPPTDLEMVVPAHAVGKVMGKGGANIDNIRKVCFFSGEDLLLSIRLSLC